MSPHDIAKNSSARRRTSVNAKPQPWFALMMDALAAVPMSRSARAMALAAVRWSNHKTGIVWPSVKTWADLAGIKRRTAQKAIRELERIGVLRRESNGLGGRHSTAYRFLIGPVAVALPEGEGGAPQAPLQRTPCAPPVHAVRPNLQGNLPVNRPGRRPQAAGPGLALTPNESQCGGSNDEAWHR